MSNKSITFKFNSQKSAEAASKLLQLAGGKLNYMVLVKLLYLADREALIRLECPITGDRMASLPYGPVLGRILNLIRGGPIDEGDSPWFDAVSPPDGYDVKLVAHAGDKNLSGAEENILNEIFDKYGRKSWQELSRITHQLPEWVDPNGGSLPIQREQILLFSGRTLEEIGRLKEELASLEKLDQEIAQYEGQEFESEAARLGV